MADLPTNQPNDDASAFWIPLAAACIFVAIIAIYALGIDATGWWQVGVFSLITWCAYCIGRMRRRVPLGSVELTYHIIDKKNSAYDIEISDITVSGTSDPVAIAKAVGEALPAYLVFPPPQGKVWDGKQAREYDWFPPSGEDPPDPPPNGPRHRNTTSTTARVVLALAMASPK